MGQLDKSKRPLGFNLAGVDTFQQKGFGLMAKTTKQNSPVSSDADNNPAYVIRSQKFLSGDTMVACSCGEIRVFPNARREGKCPRGNPWVCLAQLGLPLLKVGKIGFEND
jgi:hypothetical protein